jgi:transposase
MTDRTFFHQGDCAMSAAFIGLDLAKSVFQVHGVDAQGKVVVTKRLRRDAGFRQVSRQLAVGRVIGVEERL